MPKKRGPKHRYSQESVNKALEAVRQKTLSIRQAAATYKVPRSTIMDMMAGRRYPKERVSKTVLKPEEEEKLVQWLRNSAKGRRRERPRTTVQSRASNTERRRPPDDLYRQQARVQMVHQLHGAAQGRTHRAKGHGFGRATCPGHGSQDSWLVQQCSENPFTVLEDGIDTADR